MLTLISFVGSALPISLTFGTALRKLPGRMVFAVVSAIPSPLFRPYKKPLLSVNGANIISNSHLIRVTPFRTDAQSINECPPEAAWQAVRCRVAVGQALSLPFHMDEAGRPREITAALASASEALRPDRTWVTRTGD